jgi:hypothetical protein
MYVTRATKEEENEEMEVRVLLRAGTERKKEEGRIREGGGVMVREAEREEGER